MFPDLKKLPYEDRLSRLRLWSLAGRRNRADKIEIFKIVKGLSVSGHDHVSPTVLNSVALLAIEHKHVLSLDSVKLTLWVIDGIGDAERNGCENINVKSLCKFIFQCLCSMNVASSYWSNTGKFKLLLIHTCWKFLKAMLMIVVPGILAKWVSHTLPVPPIHYLLVSVVWTLSLSLSHTHTHTHLTALCPWLPRWAGTREVKPIWILLKQRRWVAVASAGLYAALHLEQTDNHASTPPLSFFTGRMPFLLPNQQCQSTEGTLVWTLSQ